MKFTIKPLFDYWVKDPKDASYGEVFFADIETLDAMPVSEMAETALFNELPENLTYPNITPHLFRWAAEMGAF